ncbi:hypothetical protein [Sphingomonas sp.]|jgi:hypothetical protein
MTRTTLSLFRRPAPGAQPRRINSDPLAGLTPVERAMAERLAQRQA